MSLWATLEATFVGTGIKWAVDTNLPTGSESGPSVYEEGGSVYVNGRLRDVDDESDSFAVLAWFTHVLTWCESATLTWDLDDGPRYRYEWDSAGGLRKLRGVLDL